jgi:phosphotransferase system enzyme I (PtsP)
MAGDPLSAVLLIGLGYDTLSMSAGSLLRVKSMLLNITKTEARVLARKALKMDSAEDVVKYLKSALGRPQIAQLLKS